MYANTFKYASVDVDCRYCTEFIRKFGCISLVCPYLMERMKAGAVGFDEAAAEIIPAGGGLVSRMNMLSRTFPGTMWRDERHKLRMEAARALLGYHKKACTPLHLSALYLLTSNKDICARTINCFFHDEIDFRYARRRGICEHDYALLMAAKSLYCGTPEVTQSDLADARIIDGEAFRLIINALLIARFGIDALKITERRAAVWDR